MPQSPEPRPSLPLKVKKPWGSETMYALEPGRYVGKMLLINAGHRTSLHYHETKAESLLVVSGICEITLAKEDAEPGAVLKLRLEQWHYINIPAGVRHRLAAVGEDAALSEISSSLEDSIRLEDDYGRVSLFVNGLHD